MKYRFHLLGYVHLPVSERYMGCAFTQKVVKLSKMLLSLGHKVFLYGAEGSDAPCTEFIQTHSLRDIRREWGEGDNRYEIGYNWMRNGFKHDFNAPPTRATTKYYNACVEEIQLRQKKDDFLLVMQGVYQKPITDRLDLFLICEPGIGYRGSYARYRAFESAFLRNFMIGSEHPRQGVNGRYYDRVIPNYFEEEDFQFYGPEKKKDYFFFIGRMIERKGIYTAVQTVDAIGAKLVLAGQGKIDVRSPNCEFIGYVGPEDRNQWLGEAKAVFVPTIYLEPFAGVNVEAQLCGTPVITTDFGVFPETVVQGVTGFRCSTLQDFVNAARNVDKLDPYKIRAHAVRYLTKNVKWEYQKWFDDLYRLYLSAWKVSGEPEGTLGWGYYE